MIINYVIETTRKCNLKCEHCLRGSAQRKNISNEILIPALRQLEKLQNSGIIQGINLTISGGEPTLNTLAIDSIILFLKYSDLSLYNWYIVTNGLKVNEAFLEKCRELHMLALDKEISGISISNDFYHNIELTTTQIAKRYKAEERLENSGIPYSLRQRESNKRISLIKEGRAKNWGDRDIKVYDLESRQCLGEKNFYLNIKGNIITGCDFSYKSQDKQENILCKADQFYDWFVNQYEQLEETNYG